jgi:CelD/BcsL family acetyltransferase involved in cellulose biosynthesis
MPSAALSRIAFAEADAEPPHASALTDASLGVTVFDTLAAAEPTWRRLEADAVFTPYQRFDWIAHWLAAQATTPQLAIIAIEQDNVPIALLPLAIERRAGCKQATIIGAEVGNSDWMMVRADAVPLLTRERLLALFVQAARAIGGIDFIALFNQPESWRGHENPLLGFAHQLGPNRLYLGALNEKRVFDRFDDKRVANFLRRKRKLAEAHGDVILKAATSVGDIELYHRTFIAQRDARFAQMGVANIFAEPRFQRFFRTAAIASLGQARPAAIFHALYAGDSIIATACGTFAGDHYSQYINATAGGEVAKFRLIGVLMHALFADVAARGGTSIDMGLGDFEYKTDWTEPLPVYDSIIPLSLAGRAVGGSILALRQLKRAIKQNPKLWALARKVRAKLGRRHAETGTAE